jgi:intracellular multiplication protein IcmL
MAVDYSQLEERRNNFYRDSYRKLLNVLIFLLWTALALGVYLGYLVYATPQPSYYASTTSGEVVTMHSLSEPVVTSDFILKWASLLARQIYNLNFDKWQTQLNQVQNKFTTNGWNAMQSALKASGITSSIEQNKLVTSAVVSGAPVILSREIYHGSFTWTVQFPMLVTFTSASESRKQTLIVTMRISRVPVLSAPQGIQCDGFAAKSET